ncbi:MAG: hypothetical protein K0R82_536 [Flavipsychrobacter sp.]|jgi:hypothetical protein|nr:hypothetical protein [Flavipsychrobacter sp.]
MHNENCAFSFLLLTPESRQIQMKRNYTNILLASALIAIAALARIVNREIGDLHNLAPVAAVGLFAGAVIANKRLAFILPLMAMFIADLYFELFGTITYMADGKLVTMKGFYGQEQIWVYGAMALVTVLGMFMGNVKTVKVLGFSLISSVLFFIISNFGVFLSGYWGTGAQGLATTYTMALPFFKNTIISDLVGNGLLFGLYFSLQQAMKTAPQRA